MITDIRYHRIWVNLRNFKRKQGVNEAGNRLSGFSLSQGHNHPRRWLYHLSSQEPVLPVMSPGACRSACQTCTFDLLLTFGWSTLDLISLYFTSIKHFTTSTYKAPFWPPDPEVVRSNRTGYIWINLLLWTTYTSSNISSLTSKTENDTILIL